jgi:hypothetical protein
LPLPGVYDGGDGGEHAAPAGEAAAMRAERSTLRILLVNKRGQNELHWLQPAMAAGWGLADLLAHVEAGSQHAYAVAASERARLVLPVLAGFSLTPSTPGVDIQIEES